MNPHVMSKYATELDCLRARDGWFQKEIERLQAELAQVKAQVRQADDRGDEAMRRAHNAEAELAALRQQIAEAEPVATVIANDSGFVGDVLFGIRWGSNLRGIKVGDSLYLPPPLRQPDAEVLEAMKQAVDGWEKLSDGYHDPKIIGKWLSNDMAPTITNLRAAINKLEQANGQG
jgi:hypothetical protein